MGQIAFKNPHSLQTLPASSFREIFSAAPLQFLFLWQLQKFFGAHWLIFIAIRGQTHEFEIHACISKQERPIQPFFFFREKQIDVSLSWY